MKCADPSLIPISSREGWSPAGLLAHLPEEGAGPCPCSGTQPAVGLGPRGLRGLVGVGLGCQGRPG